MSVKIICNDKTITVDNFNTSVSVTKSGRKWTLTNESGTELNIKFQVKNCCVKYTPEKYDKITIDLDPSSKEFFEMLQDLVKDEVIIENIVKSNSIGLKMSKDLKLLCLNSIKQGDFIDCIINFNNIWTVNAKHYVSLELLQFKKLDKAPKVEVINYFIEDN